MPDLSNVCQYSNDDMDAHAHGYVLVYLSFIQDAISLLFKLTVVLQLPAFAKAALLCALSPISDACVPVCACLCVCTLLR